MENPIVIAGIAVYPRPDIKATNFNIRIEKSEAERLLAQFGYGISFEIMCKEYGNDPESWTGVTPDDLDPDTVRFHEDYQTFEIWL